MRHRSILAPLWAAVGSALVALVAASPARAAVDLTALSLEELLDQKVVGASKYEQSQSDVAAAVTLITRNEIQTFGWRTLAEAMSSLPGVSTSYDRQNNYLGVRGFGLPGDFNTRVLVTVNGNRLNDPTYDAAMVGRQFPLDLDLVERIEFIPGPGAAVYGQNAMFGVINVVTRTGADLDGVEMAGAAQSLQRLSEGRVSAGTELSDGTRLLVSASGMHARGQDLNFDYGASGISGVAVGLDGEHDRQFFGRVQRGPWSLDLMESDEIKNDPTGAYFSDPLVPGQYQGIGYTLAQLQYQDRSADGALQVSGRLFTGQQRYRNVQSYGGIRSSYPTDGHWRGVELQLVAAAIERHTLMVGVEYQDNPHADQAIIEFTQPPQRIDIPDSFQRIGIYCQDEWRLSRRLSSTLGLRVDHNNDTASTNASPRAALLWQATAATVLKALYGHAYRQPNSFEEDYTDYATQAANPTLRGESLDTMELVADHLVGQNLRTRASVYDWTMDHLITPGTDPVTGFAQYQNLKSAKARGIELSADQNWSWGGRIRGSLSLQDARYFDGSTLLNAPKWLGKLNFSSPLPWVGLRLGYEWQYTSARLSLDGSDVGGYAVSNLTVGTELWTRRLQASVGAYNLFDKRYADPGSRFNWQNTIEQDGRSLRLKLLYSF